MPLSDYKKKDDKKKKPKFKIVPRKKKEEPKKKMAEPSKKKPKFKIVPRKKKEEDKKPEKKKPKFKIVPKKQPVNLFYQTPAEKMLNKSKEQINMMQQTELFGQLPKELRQKILNPKETGVKVGSRLKDLEAYIGLDYSKGDDRTLKDMQETADYNDEHYEDSFLPILLEPARDPKKNLKSYKAEFSSRNFKKYHRDDATDGNLYDLAYDMKFGTSNFREFLKNFEDKYNDNGYYKYWMDYMLNEMKERGKLVGL